MTRAYVLLTALPPTKGHMRLIEFASLAADQVEVIICTQPGEPFCDERVAALSKATQHLPNAHYNRIHKKLPQEPEGHEGFWDMWSDFLRMFGFQEGDLIVASERYGKPLAEHVGGRFIPYDIDRRLLYSKATLVRDDPLLYFSTILPEFQPNLIKTITIFGAESTGKTTLSRQLAGEVNGHLLFEWARPYLEYTGNDVTEASMRDIWCGQKALQRQGLHLRDKPFVIQDTDLFSTLGYWEMYPWDHIDPAPRDLADDAHALISDLYIIAPSNIPFEPDPLRYGGDVREATDEQWIQFAERNALTYAVLESNTVDERVMEAARLCEAIFDETADLLAFTREGAEYATA